MYYPSEADLQLARWQGQDMAHIQLTHRIESELKAIREREEREAELARQQQEADRQLYELLKAYANGELVYKSSPQINLSERSPVELTYTPMLFNGLNNKPETQRPIVSGFFSVMKDYASTSFTSENIKSIWEDLSESLRSDYQLTAFVGAITRPHFFS